MFYLLICNEWAERCLGSDMVGSNAANADNFVNMTASDTHDAIGEDLGNGISIFSRRLQYAFCTLFMFWKEQENKVTYVVGMFLMFVVLLGVIFLASFWQSCFRPSQSINICWQKIMAHPNAIFDGEYDKSECMVACTA